MPNSLPLSVPADESQRFQDAVRVARGISIPADSPNAGMSNWDALTMLADAVVRYGLCSSPKAQLTNDRKPIILNDEQKDRIRRAVDHLNTGPRDAAKIVAGKVWPDHFPASLPANSDAMPPSH